MKTVSHFCRARLQRVRRVLDDTARVKYVSGLWSVTTFTLAPKSHVSRRPSAHTTANASRSMADHFACWGVNFLLRKAMGFSCPSPFCAKHAPTAFSDASAVKMNSLPTSGTVRAGKVLRASLTALNALSASSLHRITFGTRRPVSQLGQRKHHF